MCQVSNSPIPKSPSTIGQRPQHAPKFHSRRRGGLRAGRSLVLCLSPPVLAVFCRCRCRCPGVDQGDAESLRQIQARRFDGRLRYRGTWPAGRKRRGDQCRAQTGALTPRICQDVSVVGGGVRGVESAVAVSVLLLHDGEGVRLSFFGCGLRDEAVHLSRSLFLLLVFEAGSLYEKV